MFCNCLDSLLGGGDDGRASNSSSSNVCAVYILILASLHGIICFSAFGSVRFVQCILCRLPLLSPNPHLSCLSITILWRAHIVPSNASIGFRCTLFRFFIFSGIQPPIDYERSECVCTVYCVHCTLVAISDFDDAFHHKRYKKQQFQSNDFVGARIFIFIAVVVVFALLLIFNFRSFAIGVYAFYNR